MKTTYYEIKKLPVLIIDDYYSDDARDKIWQELCFLNNSAEKFKTPESTGSAFELVDGEKVLLKTNLALMLDTVYLDRRVSSILTENRKTFTLEMMDFLEKYHYFFKYLRFANKDATILNYYENSHYYKSHRDDATITTLSFFYQQPKSFIGGNLIIENELEIECLHNRFVIFPSILLHEVQEIKINENLVGENFGRYSITQLMSINV